MTMIETHTPWPELPLSLWEPTRATLHMWTQVVGKTRVALSPLQNHFWNVALYVTPRGLTTGPIPFDRGVFDVEFDFYAHRLVVTTSAGDASTLALIPRSVAEFYRDYCKILADLGIRVNVTRVACELPTRLRLDQDEEHQSYVPEHAHRFWQILLHTDTVLKQFRQRFYAKVSPVHFFWGSFDMAFTIFSGRPAPVKADADPITREAYSHEVISVGFWPGDARYPAPAFYGYAAPAPAGLSEASVHPAIAGYDTTLGEFIMPYEAVRTLSNPAAAVLKFAESVYAAASQLGAWDPALVRRL
jgi:hypothetical protein